MWKILSYQNTIRSVLALTAILVSATQANSENVYNLNQNQTGLNLPGVTLPQGHDEVRAADGTTCRSSVSGNGAFIDVGMIGNQGTSSVEESASVYGRIVIPLGAPKGRVDCRELYNLEVERLKMEIKLLKMGINGGSQTASNMDSLETGWSNPK